MEFRVFLGKGPCATDCRGHTPTKPSHQDVGSLSQEGCLSGLQGPAQNPVHSRCSINVFREWTKEKD